MFLLFGKGNHYKFENKHINYFLIVKKILLLSDTHSYMDDRILKHASQSDEIWHAGDIGTIEAIEQLSDIKPVRAVYGNIDSHQIRAMYPRHQRFVCEGVSVWMTHIGGYPGRYNTHIKKEIYNNPPKLFICGHSHILKVQFDKKLNLLHLNPGAAGKYGFHKKRTMLRFQLEKKYIKALEIIEFEDR